MAGRRSRMRTPSVVVAAALAFVVVSAAPAGAIVRFAGITWYSDGALSKSGPSGTLVSLYATGAAPNRSYQLFSSPFVPERDHELCGYSLTPINPAVRVSNVRGFIPLTSGRVAGPPGDYVLCFVDLEVLTDPAHPEGSYSATVYAWFKII